MVKMCGNEAKVTNKRFDGNWGNLYTRDLPNSNIFLLSEYHLFNLEVNLMPYGFLLTMKTEEHNLKITTFYQIFIKMYWERIFVKISF